MRLYTIILLLIATLNLQAQNYVQNGSFEEFSQCADSYYQLDRAYFWNNPNYRLVNSNVGMYIGAELYQPCAPDVINVPNSYAGGGFAPDGNNYAGGYFYNLFYDTLDIKNYFQNELLSALKPNIYYCFKMKITLGDPFYYAVNDISVYFSPTKVADSINGVLSYLQPQITNTNGQYYVNKAGWDEYTGYFKADGGEKYMIIGSFLPTNNTPTQIIGPAQFNGAYYMIDDVQLVECGDSLNTAVEENIVNKAIKLYPNPTTGNLTVEIPGELNNARVELYDAVGKLVYSTKLTANLNTLNMPTTTNGIYSVRLWNNGSIVKRDKLVIF